MQLWSGELVLCTTLVFVSIWHCITAANPYRASYEEPKCTDPQTGRQLYIGDAYTRSGLCIRVQCLGNLHLWEDKCQVPVLKGNCNAIPTPNEFLDYPQCCPNYECRSTSTNEHGETVETRQYDHYGRLRKTHITQVLLARDPLMGEVPGSGLKTQFEI